MPALNVSTVMICAEDAMDVPPITPLKPVSLVSDEVRVIMNWVLYGAMIPIIDSFGIASNVVNIICFVRQGLKDPVNVSVLGLALSDLGHLITSLAVSICYNPALETLDLPVVMVDLVYYAFGPILLLFNGLTAWITALITMERCLCITMPVKVKSIVTAKRVTITIICIFITFTCSGLPQYLVCMLSWIFLPSKNTTILQRVSTDQCLTVEQISNSLNGALIPFTAYFTIIICTVTLVSQLRKKARWRLTCVTPMSADSTSKRDQTVAKMVVAISTVFIACFTPMCVLFILIIAMPGLAVNGPNQNLLYIFAGLNLVLQSANSSANIFIYYHMSSRYRSTFRDLFRFGTIGIKSQKP